MGPLGPPRSVALGLRTPAVKETWEVTTVRAWPPRVPSSHVARSRQPGGVSRPELGRIQAWSLQSPAPGLPPSASSHQEGTLLPRLASLGPQTGLAGCDTMGSAQRKDVLPGHRPGGDSRRLGAPGAATEFGAGSGEGGWSARSPPPHPRVRGRLRPSEWRGHPSPALPWGLLPRLPVVRGRTAGRGHL